VTRVWSGKPIDRSGSRATAVQAVQADDHVPREMEDGTTDQRTDAIRSWTDWTARARLPRPTS